MSHEPKHHHTTTSRSRKSLKISLKRGLPALCLLLLVGVPCPALAAASGPAPSADSRPDPYLEWIEFLERIYLLLGGDPALLVGDSPDMVVSSVAELYGQQGLSSASAPEREEIEAIIVELAGRMSSPPSQFSSASIELLQDTLVAMWIALGNSPYDLPF